MTGRTKLSIKKKGEKSFRLKNKLKKRLGKKSLVSTQQKNFKKNDTTLSDHTIKL